MVLPLCCCLGRGVFSCTEFDKGDFLLEYRGDLISKEEYERRQRIYHDALKVFMFEFRYNGKLLCVDAARDDGSLGRLVNDDHINPNSRMRTISVDGKPHLCLFATRSISPGEEITYDYGDSEWPWRCTAHSEVEPSTHTLSQSEVTDLEKARSEVEPSTHTLSQSEVTDLEKVAPKKDQLPLDQDCVEKMSLVKEHVLNEEQSFCAPAEGVKEVCKHVVVTSAISSMDKCAECVGPVAALKWIGLRCKLCSSFWHKSCYSKLHEWNGKQSSWEVSSEEDELSDEEYIPQSESDNQSDSSDELTTRPACYDQANLLSDIQEAAASKFSEPQRSDVTALNVSKGKGKGVLKAREAASVYNESDLLCHEEQLTDVETDSDSDCSGERHLPRKQGSGQQMCLYHPNHTIERTVVRSF
ncbi:uncharacterized protein LOC131536523 [Onychostoma macrolepis]|uniref:uncharacterized protein LOC131536523 n=1 Tax=Onychostoma macrolepis TaxID=369639 RepID=UPI00272DB082|nr:uncharacterized protein LOC131536523 [Onychostoma macrolepis]